MGGTLSCNLKNTPQCSFEEWAQEGANVIISSAKIQGREGGNYMLKMGKHNSRGGGGKSISRGGESIP